MRDADGQAADPGDTGELAEVIRFKPLRPAPAGGRGGPDDAVTEEPKLRTVIGDVLRDERLEQARTLADVAADAAISLPYLSEIERGRKEVSSDLLGAVCDALDVPLVEVLERCVERLRARAEGGSGIQLRAA